MKQCLTRLPGDVAASLDAQCLKLSADDMSYDSAICSIWGDRMSKRIVKSARKAPAVKRPAEDSTSTRNARPDRFQMCRERVEAVMAAAQRAGLLADKVSLIAGRVSPKLVEEAKRRTGLSADTDLITFALANLALEDKFAGAFAETRGRIEADLKLGFWN